MGMTSASTAKATAARWPNGPRTPDCHPDRPHRARGLCALCYAGALRRVHYADPERRERRLASQKAYHDRNPEKSHHDWLRFAYGVSPEDVAEMRERQGGACAICGRTDLRLNVDHDHATGEIRGLLCDPCNRGIGQLGDDPERLLRAVAYLTDKRRGEA